MTTFIDIVFVCLALFSRDHNYNTVPLFEISKSNTEMSYGPAGTTVPECWRKVRVALGPGLVIRVTMNDPRWELSGRFHLGPSRTLAWVFIGGLS